MSLAKSMYVVRGDGAAFGSFAGRMRGPITASLLGAGPARLKLTVTEAPPPRPSLFGFRRYPVAVFCVWGEQGAHARFGEVLGRLDEEVSGYQVEESTPVAYERTWPDGEPTPSPILLTLLRRKRGLSDEEYIQRWHGGHTPLSLEVHPLWYYVRNVIKHPLNEAARTCDGIVEEACHDRGELLNPAKFFGGPLRMAPNMVRVAKDIQGFLDTSKIEVFYATEYHLRS